MRDLLSLPSPALPSGRTCYLASLALSRSVELGLLKATRLIVVVVVFSFWFSIIIVLRLHKLLFLGLITAYPTAIPINIVSIARVDSEDNRKNSASLIALFIILVILFVLFKCHHHLTVPLNLLSSSN